MFNIIGNIASIATIILFVFYFIGRFWIILLEKEKIYEKVDVFYDQNKLNKYEIVERYPLEKDSNTFIIITPTERAYNFFKIYEYDDNLNTKKCIYEKHDRIYPGSSILINADLQECITKYVINFERNDYMIGEMDLSSNRKNGVQEELIKCKHTWKSLLYYIVKWGSD